MGIEIERKFLVRNDTWRTTKPGVLYRQGYLCTNSECCIRIRITETPSAWLTIKGQVETSIRLEYEYPVSLIDANEMLNRLCAKRLIEKTRYLVPYSDLVWEIDEFSGENTGLIIAEVELTHRDQHVELPPWVGNEVTEDVRYYNAYLAVCPYQTWNN